MPVLLADDAEAMSLALTQARLAASRGEVPVGAVLVRRRPEAARPLEVLALGHNQPIALHDPTAHAEIMVLRAGASYLQNYRLPGCELFVTLEPCAMCAMALMHARISRVVFGTPDPKTGAAGSVVNLFAQSQLNHHTTVEGGLLAQASGDLLREFFAERRRASSLRNPAPGAPCLPPSS